MRYLAPMPVVPSSRLAQSVLKGTGTGSLPPMLEQYVAMRDEVAAQLPHAILLFQVGDFYETFGEDAERTARLLGLALTHKSSKDFSTPMAGIPLRTLDGFVEKLLAAGVCVAVADQMEEAGSGLVERKVTQLLTPGTVTADVSQNGNALLVHCLHAPDPDAVAADIKSRYESRLLRIFS